jgi:formate hydrogenlyase subunit 3/multisubunit Na+/H+ antiporter MnhD subunit
MEINILLFPVFLPIAIGGLLFFIPRKVNLARGIIAFLTTCVVFIYTARIVLLESLEMFIPLFTIETFSLDFDLIASSAGGVFLLFIAGFGVLISLYSLSYMRGKEHSMVYYSCFLFALGASVGVVTANHFIVFLIFWEVVTASLYFLIASGKPESRTGATKTFVMLGASDGSLLLGIGLFWFINNSFTMGETGIPLNGWLPVLSYLFILLGALTKAGSMPLHTWIPSASDHSPASAMAFLPAAIDKFLGIYLLVRISTSLFTMNESMGLVLMIIGSVTIVTAVMAAMVQHELKRLLSYHAISQVGYMVLGIGTMTPIGIAGGLFHMLNNSIYKSGLFLSAGAVERKTGTTELSKLGGLSKAMPVTFLAALVCMLAISGIPIFNGFVSKWMVYQGTLSSATNINFIFLIAAMFGSALTLASFIKVLYSVFLGRTTEYTAGVKRESPLVMIIPMVILAVLCLAFGIYYDYPLTTFIYPVVGEAAQFMGTWFSSLATILLLIGLAAGFILFWILRVLKTARIAPPFIGGEEADESIPRLSGAEFYNTVRDLPLLRGLYRAQEKGSFDLYVLMGRCGLGITWILKKLHNGLLSRYLLWSITGTIVLIVLAAVLL